MATVTISGSGKNKTLTRTESDGTSTTVNVSTGKIISHTPAKTSTSSSSSSKSSSSSSSSKSSSSSSSSKAKTVSGYTNSQNLTTDEVKKIQKANGLAVDGIIGKDTQSVLNKGANPSNPTVKSSSSSSSSSKSSSSSSSSSSKTLKLGTYNSAEVADIQRKLGITADGDFGPETEAAVKEYQRANGLAVDGIVGTNTLAKLNYTPTNQNYTTTSSKTNEEKPNFTTKINGTLSLGSQGDDVKEIQRYLNGLGYPGSDGQPVKVDGIYGPDTKATVMQWQQANGLSADGIFGPNSFKKYNEISTTEAQESILPNIEENPEYITPEITTPTPEQSYVTGNASLDATLAELQKFIKDQQEAGLKLNEALNFDQETIDKFLETARSQIHPYYAQQIDAIRDDVIRAAPQILQNYESDIVSKRSSFIENLGATRENYAGAGLTFSGQRAAGEEGMLAAQNRDLASLSQDYGNKLYELGRTTEEKIGASAMGDYKLPLLSQYSATLGGTGNLNQTGTYRPYTPGGYKIGSLTREEEAAIEARNQALKKTASEAVVAGRSYQDLFK